MRSVDSKFYKGKRWKKTREAYIKTVGGLCERCLKNGEIKPAYIVHHKVHLTEDNVSDDQYAYDFNNLEALCLECHNAEHFGNTKTKERYKIDEMGRVIID